MDGQQQNETLIHVTLKLFGNKSQLLFPDHTTVEQAIRQLKCPFFIVVYNGKYLPAEEYANTFLKEGDKIELLTAVGGG